MTADEIRSLLIAELAEIAPDQDASTLAVDADIRESLDIDSMDFLNFVTALHKKLGVDVPERDYPKLFTLAKAIAYLEERTR
jgi:acyl carrier protein